jgi:hypothetical protein
MSCSSRCAVPDASRRAALLALAGGLIAPCAAQGPVVPPGPVLADLPGARLQGQGTLRFLGLHIYDARLWVPAALRPETVESSPLALELQYARTLRGPLIAERSLEEMRRVGEVSAADGERWLTALQQLLPDVQAGDRIAGVQRPGVSTRFHFNERFLGEVRDPAFTRLFFGIWLSPRTSEPRLRAALLGLG